MARDPGVPFGALAARKGYALNKMCFSLNESGNRTSFLRDEDGYCARFGLNAQQREAVRARDLVRMLEAGGNTYYLAKLAGVFGLDLNDLAPAPLRRSD